MIDISQEDSEKDQEDRWWVGELWNKHVVRFERSAKAGSR